MSRKSRAWVLAGGKVRLTCPSEDGMLLLQSIRETPRNTKNIAKVKNLVADDELLSPANK